MVTRELPRRTRERAITNDTATAFTIPLLVAYPALARYRTYSLKSPVRRGGRGEDEEDDKDNADDEDEDEPTRWCDLFAFARSFASPNRGK